VLDENLEGNDLEGVLVGGLEDDGTSGSGLLDLEPARGTDAPAVARFEAGKAVLWHGRDEIVAKRTGRLEEGLVDDAADGVEANVVGPGVAASVAVEASHGLAATGLERLAEDIAGGRLDRLGGGHEISFLQYVTVRSDKRARHGSVG
jgi:hypothetical protein